MEVSQAKGRSKPTAPNAVVHTEQTIYVLEFKLNQSAGRHSAEAALEQIKQQGYTTPYLNQGKRVTAAGFNFSSEQKAIDQWQEEVIQETAR